MPELDASLVAMILEMGFSEAAARRALFVNGMDLMNAVNYLTTNAGNEAINAPLSQVGGRPASLCFQRGLVVDVGVTRRRRLLGQGLTALLTSVVLPVCRWKCERLSACTGGVPGAMTAAMAAIPTTTLSSTRRRRPGWLIWASLEARSRSVSTLSLFCVVFLVTRRLVALVEFLVGWWRCCCCCFW